MTAPSASQSFADAVLVTWLRGPSQTYGRNRLPHRRQDAVAAHRLDDLLSRSTCVSHPKRGSLLADVTGTVVHDHWAPYYTMKAVLHALCNACIICANP